MMTERDSDFLRSDYSRDRTSNYFLLAESKHGKWDHVQSVCIICGASVRTEAMAPNYGTILH